MSYPIAKVIQYTNDKEYRQCLREIFTMAEQPVMNERDLDEISKDEMNYDEKMTEKWVKWVSRQTTDSYELQELYKLASATMMSLDRDTGLAVLFSYDYFKDFHLALSAYLNDKDVYLDLIPSYERLWRRLSQK
jgi:hypothetical protein